MRQAAAGEPKHTGTALALLFNMPRPLAAGVSLFCVALIAIIVMHSAHVEVQADARYRIQAPDGRIATLRGRFTESQSALLEKLNRADIQHLAKLPALVVPATWDDELSYSVLPYRYPSNETWPKSLVVYVPGQLFGAYEYGTLVRWGPVSTGSRNSQTPSGLFALNWRSEGRTSTVDPDWFMPWYFNFGNREGLAFHMYELPGHPASHGCIRLLERDAQWLYEWGETWTLDASGTRLLVPGTPVLIVGRYDFDAAPPWRSLEWLSSTVQLPAILQTAR